MNAARIGYGVTSRRVRSISHLGISRGVSHGERLVLFSSRRVPILRLQQRSWLHEGVGDGKSNSPSDNDWAEKLTKSVEQTWKSTSEQAMSKTRAIVQRASNRVTSSSQQALKSVESKMASWKDSLQSQASDMAQQAAKSTQDLAQKASQSAVASSQKVLQLSQNYVQTKTSQVIQQFSETAKRNNPVVASQRLAKAASDRVVATAQQAVQRSADYASSSFQGATEKATTAVTNLSTSMERLARSAFWYLLAAVAVYGMASTLPVEIFRYLTRQDAPNEDSTKSKTDNDK